MKPLSPSSAASTSTSYGGASGSCLMGVLRRIFRSSSLPGFPVGCADGKVEEFSSREEVGIVAETPVPGIVARLMGLETLPRIGEKSPVSVPISWSMNDLDYREKCDEDGDRRSSVKSASSFRETPTFLEIENEEFLVMIFGNGTETEDGTCRGRKKRRKRRRNRTSILVKDKGNSPGENSAVDQNLDSAEKSSLANLRNVKSNQEQVLVVDKQAEVECIPENSLSPVSVLGFEEFISSDLETSTSDEWTTEDSGNLLNEQQSPSPSPKSRQQDTTKQLSYPDLQIPSFSWETTAYNDTWKYADASADICADLGCEISDELIVDLIVQLSGRI